MSNVQVVRPGVQQSYPTASTRQQEDFVANHIGDSLEIRPVPVATVRRPGPRVLHVLLFGGGPLLGDGLRDHDRGLPGRIADQLVATSGRGVEVEVIADAHPARQMAVNGLRGLRLQRYDAVVLVLGAPLPDASARSSAFWAVELVRVLLTESRSAAPLMVLDSTSTEAQPRSFHARTRARVARIQAQAVAEACARTGRVRFNELDQPGRFPLEGRPFDAGQFEIWAEFIVDRLVRHLEVLTANDDGVGARPDDERLRQRALGALRLGRQQDQRLEAIVKTAKETYGAAGAAINIIDGDEQWSKVSFPHLEPLPRKDSFCAMAINSDSTMLINDARLDERVVGSPFVQGELGLRFYASHPIRTWDGYKIGTICVYGMTPRRMRQSELEPLRDLASQIEQQLWSEALRHDG